MSVEAKVGAFTLAGLALLAGVVIMLSGFRLGGDKGYTLYAGFKQVVGVEPQSAVRLSGVPVGKVKSVANDGRGVTVTLQINDGVQIPKGSQVSIGSSGIMSDKFINITPGESSAGYLSDGDYLTGQDEASMDEMLQTASKVITEAQELLSSMNNIVGNEAFQTSIVQMVVNMRDTTAHINGMMAALEATINANQGNINQILTNMNMITGSLNRTMNNVEAMMANLATVGADPQTAENLRLTLDNIAQTSEKIRVVSEGLAKVAGDEKTVEDVKKTIHNARELTEKAKRGKEKLEAIKTSGELSTLYSGSAHDWDTNWNFTAALDKGPFLTFGLEDMGEANRVNFQVGKRKGNLAARVGAIHGDAGVGLDAYAGKNFKFSAEAYDFDDTAVRLGAQLRLKDNTWLMGQWQNVNDKDRRAAYVGLKQAF
ncbi:putative ABC transporter periplasmic substrate-binding protein [Selenomonas ruminantium subsp. lactilytica TAM6421]|uniref:Putative ABC transporter periplasmic substrate-binding protein n=1 Tax=Selenomonas ruminantium subsp. lactilytica (strain NBRC 103574 / TAM6421) TaxID=927704 RepID=I0GU82_SELRL|nr:MlaD family protein [Selenomonas ruminantium]BAL84319.1 putative ABC transporter periplasmic substrate-binding protein [Selenomonas ruminantium subsp. lactilytica TAM6421]